MRSGAVIIAIWLIIGAVAAAQRNYFAGSDVTCAGLGTIAITMVAGPLNYLGLNPKIDCTLPQPSP